MRSATEIKPILESTTATFDNDTALVAMDSDSAIASQKLQLLLLLLLLLLLATQNWFKKWRMKANKSKPVYVTTFTTRIETPPSPGSYKQCATLPRRRYQVSWATRLTWHKHIFAKGNN
jgi:hypothetical protein